MPPTIQCIEHLIEFGVWRWWIHFI